MRALVSIVIAACSGGDSKPAAPASAAPATAAAAPAPAAPAPAPEPSCEDVASHFADYLSPTHDNSVWPDAHADILELCDDNKLTADERRCWMQIHDAASHQACLDLRTKLGLPGLRLKPDGDDDDLFDDDDDGASSKKKPK